MASSSVMSPSTTEVKPRVPSTCMNRWSLGLRRSASTTATRLPERAKVIARLVSDVVLASPALALVIWMMRSGRSSAAYCTAVRSPR